MSKLKQFIEIYFASVKGIWQFIITCMCILQFSIEIDCLQPHLTEVRDYHHFYHHRDPKEVSIANSSAKLESVLILSLFQKYSFVVRTADTF
jgi:hypothetical protein